MDVLNCPQFKETENENDNIFVKIENKVKSFSLEMRRQELISERIEHRLRTTGGQPACLYDLEKFHKTDTPLKPVLSIPGCRYFNLNKFLTSFFEKLPGANIETTTLDARKKSELIALYDNK